MAETTLTREHILEAAEDVLRRFGPGKATVVDVARALGVSHGTVYRHFPSKAALREAVTERWLNRAHAALPAVATGPQRPDRRLRLWLETLFEAKRHKALDDPELFATFTVLTDESSALVDEHLAALELQLSAIIAEGQDDGLFAAGDPGLLAHAVFQATSHFHDPGYAPTWSRPTAAADLGVLIDLLLRGSPAPDSARPGAPGAPRCPQNGRALSLDRRNALAYSAIRGKCSLHSRRSRRELAAYSGSIPRGEAGTRKVCGICPNGQ
ncbi:TetR/AcrR family transcriptional regulator [Streptacidiphilus sp. 4-A2]|nr:TetR/AcrR family transcriptional regulator [Streptacidiphilus sp. 4-A2]